MSSNYIVQPGGALQGQIRVPGDKSISHRALLLGAIAEGTTTIHGFLASEDTLATLNALRAMGVMIEVPSASNPIIIHGVGMHGLKTPTQILDCGNSGTSMRLLTGLLAGQGFAAKLIGDSSLNRRPMKRVTDPLTTMGASIETTEGFPPLKINPCPNLCGINYTLPVASAQVKSALLLAGLYATGTTTLTEPIPTRNHTERMLAAFNCPLEMGYKKITITGGSKLIGTSISVPADISSAAFFMVAASITPGSDLTLLDVGINPTRTGIIAILQAMGADISLHNNRLLGTEPIADIQIRYTPLHGITIPMEWVSLAIDEFPVLFIAAANAKGETILTGAKELRIKESDRIQVMANGLNHLGVIAEPMPDGIRIQGGSIGGGTVQSHGDHRIAMAFAIAGINAKTSICIENCDNVATSFPTFLALAQNCGINVKN